MINKFKMLNLPHVFKNNRIVCEFLGRRYIKHKDSISSVEKELSQYCKWHKKGHRYIVTEIHSAPLEKEDGRKNNKGGNNNVYSDHIDALLIRTLEAEFMVTKPFSYFKNKYKLCNENYYEIAKKAKEIADCFGYPTWYVYDFFINTRSMAKRIFEGSLSRLKNKGCISSTKIKMKITVDGEYEEASEYEINKIQKIKNNILQEMNYDNEQSCIFHGKYDIYLNKMSRIAEEELGIMLVYDNYNIAKAVDINGHYNAFFDELLCHNLDLDHASILNDLLCKNIIKNAEKRRQRSIERVDNDTINSVITASKSDHRRASNMYDYIKFYQYMVDTYIKLE